MSIKTLKTPDKIYLPGDIDWPSAAILTLGNQPGDVEYLRKDVLLEWAKEKYNEYKQMDEDFHGDVFIGNRHAFAEVITKIESL